MIFGILILRYSKQCRRCNKKLHGGANIPVLQTARGNRRHYCEPCGEIMVAKTRAREARFGELNGARNIY